jgi:sulfur carrier protein
MIIFVNGDPREVEASASLADLVSAAARAGGRGVAVAVDGIVVPRAQHAATQLREGARVEIVSAVQGG